MNAPALAAMLVAVAVSGALAGCTRAEPVNPNLLAPKLIVDAGPRGEPIVFVHSAFGERAYDRIELSVDNETVRAVEYAYSLEENLDASPAFLEVKVRSGESRFLFRGTVALNLSADRLEVATVQDGEWSGPREFALPFERILEREEGERA